MKKRNVILGAIASLGLGLASASWAAPTLTSEVLIFSVGEQTIVDPDGDYDPGIPDFGAPLEGATITLQPNTYYVVGIRVSLGGTHNMSDTARSGSTFDNKPLGLQNVAARVLASGTPNAFTPVSNGLATPGWVGIYGPDLASYQLSPFFPTNLLEAPAGTTSVNSQNPVGAGFANTSLSLSTATGPLAKYQAGVVETIMTSGLFKTGASGSGTLFTSYSTALAYKESADADTAKLETDDLIPGAINVPVAFQIAGASGPDSPEATALAKAGYAVLDIPVQGGNGQYVSPIVPGGPDKKVAIDLTQTVPGGVGPESDTLYVMLRLVGSQAAFDAWKTNAGIAPFINLTSGLEGQGAYAGIFGGQDANNHAVVLRFSTQTGPGAERFANIDLGADLSLGAAAAVPEPATLSLLALGAVGLLSRRRR